MRYFYTAVLLFFSVVSLGQAATQPLHYKFRVYLSDKGASVYSTDEPERFLSEKAIKRKKRQNVAVDASDFPISPDYFTLVEKTGAKVIAHSKWLQTLTVEVTDSLKINQLISLPFVDSVKYVWRGHGRSYRNSIRPRLVNIDCTEKIPSDTLFGLADKQYRIHHADKLARAGFRGKGIDVGVIDAGFTNFDVIPYFSSVRLRGWMNFVPEGEIFSSSEHGTKVLSTMATNQPGLLLGSASEADYWLLRSEDVTSEFPVEEDYWVRAIEYADSLGIDLINSSLGYNQFDDKDLNYSFADLTGEVSFMSRAADVAFKKGMLIVVSAGNEGSKPWQKITPPGDARHVLAVGAVGIDSVIASFSSHGLMEDGRVKPDLVSVGKGTITIGQEGLIGFTNGTSLSSPFLAGLITSLWSVNPDLHRAELIDIIKQSADRYLIPDSVYGNGIPDFQKAMCKVLATLPVVEAPYTGEFFTISRPSVNDFLITFTQPDLSPDDWNMCLLDESGELISAYTSDKNSFMVSVPRAYVETGKFVHLLFK